MKSGTHNVEMNWSKNMPPEEKRSNALETHDGNELATARALQALAKARLVKTEADYLFLKRQ